MSTEKPKETRDSELDGLGHLPDFEACHVLIARIRNRKPISKQKDQAMAENFRRAYGGTEARDA